MLEDLIDYAKQYTNTPYIWGGDNPLIGFDCSGYIQWCLASVGYDPVGDQTSQALFNHFGQSARGTIREGLQKGALVFYGKSQNKITHISLAINLITVIECGGGDRRTRTKQDAIRLGACVRQKAWGYRNDCISVIMPKYSFL